MVVLGGVGYALMWRDGEKRQRFDFKPGSLFVPGAEEWHQWFNTGSTPATCHSMNATGNGRHRRFMEIATDPEFTEVSVSEGGNQIEYREEDPTIHREFEAELAKHGARCRMRGLVAGCTGDAVGTVGAASR